MEYASSIRYHHNQLSSSPSPSSFYGSTTIHDNQTPMSSILNTNGFTPYPNEILNPRAQHNNIQLSYSSMSQAFDFHWANTTDNLTTDDLHLPKIKEDISDYYNLKYHGLIKNPDSLDMNLLPLDLLPSSRFCGNFTPDSSLQYPIELIGDASFSYKNLDRMQKSCPMPLYTTSNKVYSSNESAADAKRSSSNYMEPDATKKSCLDGRVSCPPFKVRKEKLGDRIAALQQLVAPFGKTDTASVLMEAIGYIKFLQTQVEVLSVPYMKKSWHKTTRPMKIDPTLNEGEESKDDLRTRGLCLVPLMCMSYITEGGGGGVVWPPSQYGGAA